MDSSKTDRWICLFLLLLLPRDGLRRHGVLHENRLLYLPWIIFHVLANCQSFPEVSIPGGPVQVDLLGYTDPCRGIIVGSSEEGCRTTDER